MITCQPISGTNEIELKQKSHDAADVIEKGQPLVAFEELKLKEKSFDLGEMYQVRLLSVPCYLKEGFFSVPIELHPSSPSATKVTQSMSSQPAPFVMQHPYKLPHTIPGYVVLVSKYFTAQKNSQNVLQGRIMIKVNDEHHANTFNPDQENYLLLGMAKPICQRLNIRLMLIYHHFCMFPKFTIRIVKAYQSQPKSLGVQNDEATSTSKLKSPKIKLAEKSPQTETSLPSSSRPRAPSNGSSFAQAFLAGEDCFQSGIEKSDWFVHLLYIGY